MYLMNVNRRRISVAEAKDEVGKREENHLKKWRRMYVGGDKDWVYWDRKYYDLVVNTYSLNAQESLDFVLKSISPKSS